jgi:hypothetical protein
VDRVPFIALFAGSGWLTFTLTRRLFDARAGLWALFALNVSAFFLVSGGGWIVPDGPLIFALLAAALVAAGLFFEQNPSPSVIWRRWLAIGFWIGFAGLSKYSAALSALGLVAFVALDPRQRRWLAHPAPYAAALLCLAMLTPVVVWNARNGWVSLAFQGARGAPGAHWRFDQVGAMALGEIALLTPWVAVPLALALVDAARRAAGDGRRLFLICLAAPPIVLFTLTPLWGARGLPHWPMPGWLFVYPLLGAWIVDPARRFNARRWAIVSTAVMAAITIVLVAQADTGWLSGLVGLKTDPTLEAFGWDALRRDPLFDPASPDRASFVVTDKWSDAGKIAQALGPSMPVLILSGDPRGFAFLDDSAKYLGRDGVIVLDRRRAASIAAFRPYFERLDAPRTLAFGRSGRDEVDLVLIGAHHLVNAFALPYPERIAPAPANQSLP